MNCVKCGIECYTSYATNTGAAGNATNPVLVPLCEAHAPPFSFITTGKDEIQEYIKFLRAWPKNGIPQLDVPAMIADKLESLFPKSAHIAKPATESYEWVDANVSLPPQGEVVRVAYRVNDGDGDGSWHYETDIASFSVDGWYNESGVGRYRHALAIQYWHRLLSVDKLTRPCLRR